MTKRSTQFTATAAVPTGPINPVQSQPKTEQDGNPLSAFFRKSKLAFTLPSRGQWYPTGSLVLPENGVLSVFAMTASDDIKFRTGDATMTGRNIYEVIQSCIPAIKTPELIPHIDIDAILLAIRVASYGPTFDFKVSVPNTKLTRDIQIDALRLLSNSMNPDREDWDDSITITDETGQSLSVTIYPISMKNLFETSKNIYVQRKNLTKNVDADENIKDDATFRATMNALTNSAIELLSTSIQKLTLTGPDHKVLTTLEVFKPQDALQIKQLINQLDVEYFNAIRDHIDVQRKKYQFMSDEQISTKEELAAGAPEKWTAELTFMGSNFLPEPKTANTIA